MTRLLRPIEAGIRVRRGETWVRTAVRRGDLRAVTLDGALRIREDDLADFIERLRPYDEGDDG